MFAFGLGAASHSPLHVEPDTNGAGALGLASPTLAFRLRLFLRYFERYAASKLSISRSSTRSAQSPCCSWLCPVTPLPRFSTTSLRLRTVRATNAPPLPSPTQSSSTMVSARCGGSLIDHSAIASNENSL